MFLSIRQKRRTRQPRILCTRCGLRMRLTDQISRDGGTAGFAHDACVAEGIPADGVNGPHTAPRGQHSTPN